MRFLTLALLATIVFCLAVPVDSTVAEDWYRWRGPRLDGVSREVDFNVDWPAEGPAVVFSVEVGTGFSAVSVGGGRVYTMGNQENVETVFCLGATCGKVLWKHEYECALDDRFFEGGPTSTPTIAEGVVHVLSRQGDLFCFNADDGNVRWSKNLADAYGVRIPGWGFSGSPVVHGELLLLTVGEAGMAIDRKTGELVWQSADKEAGYATPVPIEHDGRSYVVVPSGRSFHAVEIDTGREWWRQRWLTTFGCNAADPVVTPDGHVLLSSGYNRGSALLRMTDGEPEVVWSSKELGSQFASSILLGDHLFGIDGDEDGRRRLRCIAWKTGEVLWTEDRFSPAAISATLDRLIILSETGELIIARATPEGFQPLARAAVLDEKCWTVPVLSNGRIYCRSVAGRLVCLDVRLPGETPSLVEEPVRQ